MTEIVRTAQWEDLPTILNLYADARLRMAKNGNPTQWGTTNPPRALLEQDVAAKRLYVIVRDGVISGVFCLMFGEDPTYKIIDGQWHSSAPYATIHRIAGQGGGIFASCIRYCETLSDYLRVDTHENNYAMQRAIDREGFSFCGIIHVEDGSPRRAYDRMKKS